MTTKDEQRAEFVRKLQEARQHVPQAETNKYIEFLFAPWGGFARGVGITFTEAAIIAAALYLPQTWGILLTVFIVSVTLFLLVPWKPLVLRILGKLPPQEKK